MYLIEIYEESTLLGELYLGFCEEENQAPSPVDSFRQLKASDNIWVISSRKYFASRDWLTPRNRLSFRSNPEKLVLKDEYIVHTQGPTYEYPSLQNTNSHCHRPGLDRTRILFETREYISLGT